MNVFLCNNETLSCGPIPFVSIEARITETRNNVVHYVKMQFFFLMMILDFLFLWQQAVNACVEALLYFWTPPLGFPKSFKCNYIVNAQ